MVRPETSRRLPGPAARSSPDPAYWLALGRAMWAPSRARTEPPRTAALPVTLRVAAVPTALRVPPDSTTRSPVMREGRERLKVPPVRRRVPVRERLATLVSPAEWVRVTGVLVVTTSSVGPGRAPPLQLCGSDQSPAAGPVQVTVPAWAAVQRHSSRSGPAMVARPFLPPPPLRD